MNLQKAISSLKIIAITYAVIGILFYTFQEKIIFNPTKIEPESSYGLKHAHVPVWISIDESSKSFLAQFNTTKTNKKGVVLYFHGNKGNIKRYERFVDRFNNNGYDVWMIDYPGYGKSTGELTEANLYEQSLQLYKLARTQFNPDQIIIYGKSMGTGMASQLASVRDCKRLILETPYYSMQSLIGMYMWMYPLKSMLKYHFYTNEYLLKVTAPITIMHGTNDGVIPYRNAVRLAAILKPIDEFITIQNGAHRNLNDFPMMQQKIDSLLSK